MPYDDTNDPELIILSEAVLQAFTPEVYNHIISLLPTPEAYAVTHGQLTSGYTAFLKGDPDGVKAFESNRSAIKEFLAMLSGLAKTAAIKDPTVPERLRLNQVRAKSGGISVPLTAPCNFTISYDRNGCLYIRFSKVKGAKGYQIWICEGEPSVEANWRLATSLTNSKKTAAPALDRTKNNWLKVRAMRGVEVGPWSSLVLVSSV